MINNLAQAPKSVVMIRPHYFRPNPETANDNSFQTNNSAIDAKELSKRAFDEVSNAAKTLENYGIVVHLFDDETTVTPDSVFPNNWFSTHHNGDIGVYPMYCHNRRAERRADIIDFLSSTYKVSRVVDYSDFELKELYLEGTGSMVLDHTNRIAYAVKSNRMDITALGHFCRDFGYQGVAFDAFDKKGVSVYHTNVFMCVATDFVLIALDMIKDKTERKAIVNTIEASGKIVITLSEEQIEQFAGNAIEVESEKGQFLVMSQTGVNALQREQVAMIEEFVDIIAIDVSTVELAGGSIRCMIAGIHLPKKS